ncbi:MAG: hypothetical protein ACK5F7_23150 [Planctomycetaceae bacterium]|jgi:hypothetical protein
MWFFVDYPRQCGGFPFGERLNVVTDWKDRIDVFSQEGSKLSRTAVSEVKVVVSSQMEPFAVQLNRYRKEMLRQSWIRCVYVS